MMLVHNLLDTPHILVIPISVVFCDDINILHGDVNQSEPIRVGVNVHVTCHHGYHLSEGDNDDLKCTEDGNYDHNIPNCIGKKSLLLFSFNIFEF